MTMHFEELWEKCEKLHQEAAQDEESAAIIDELIMKINVYKVINQKSEIPSEEQEKIKSRTLGEILLTLTNLSLKDNINVFDALGTAFKYRSIGHYSNKHK